MNQRVRAGLCGTGKLFAVLGLLVALGAGGPVTAQTIWTNTASGASGYWTNGVLWGTTVGNYPGSGASTSAALSNNSAVAGGTYTNVLNSGLNSTISTLTISNGNGGEAWLIVTNGASATTVLTNSTLNLGSGGRLQIDSGGVVTGITALSWLGTNGTLVLNQGGQLFSTAGINLTGAGRTGLVTTVSSTGGVWNLGAGNLLINGGAGLIISGATLTNFSSQTSVGTSAGTGSSLTISNGAQVFSVGQFLAGSVANASNNTINIGGLGAVSTWYTTNNAFAIGSGANGSAGGNFNTLTVTNASLTTGAPAALNDYIGHSSTNNTVNVLAGGYWTDRPVGSLDIGAGTAAVPGTGNLLNINGGTVTNTLGLLIGVGVSGGGIGNGVTIANGGTYISPAGIIVVGNNTGDTGNYYNIGGVGAASLASNSTIYVGNTGAGNDSMTLTNALQYSAGAIIGSGSSNNTATIQAGGTWNALNGVMYVGFGAATGNVLTINNGILTNANGIVTGNSAGSSGNSLSISAGSRIYNNGALDVGLAAGANNNTVMIGGLGAFSTVTNATEFQVGSAGNTASIGGNGNTLTVTNASLFTAAAGNNSGIGYSSTNNTVNVLAGGSWTLAPANFFIGAGTASAVATGNVLNINAGTVTSRSGGILIGSGTGGGGIGNGLTIANGGQFISAGGVTVGNGAGDSNNYYNVGGLGAASYATNSGVAVGSTGASLNTLTVTNALLYGAGPTVGNAASSNTASVLAGGTWNAGNGNLFVGNGTATGNVLVVNGGVLTNPAGLYLGYNVGAIGNSVTLSNGAQMFGGLVYLAPIPGANSNTFNVGGLGAPSLSTNSSIFEVVSAGNGGPGGNANTLNVSNATFWAGNSGFWSVIGYSSTNNSINVLSNGTATLAPYQLVVGSGTSGAPGVGNLLNINGGTLTNATTVLIGGNGSGSGGYSNGVTVANGGQFINTVNTITVGYDVGVSNNYYNVGGVGAASVVSNAAIIVGNTAAGYNTLTVTNARLWSTGTTVGSNSSNNTATVTAGGYWSLRGNTLTAGSGSATGNVVMVRGGGVLEAGSLVVGAGAGNLITNAGGVYQFTTPTPTAITPGTFGNISLSSGTISFRAINNADVTSSTNTSTQLKNIAFSGANTFMLNAASNTAAAANQNYTFQSVTGSPSNYVGLAMINGTTAYGNGNITIGSTGSMLVSGTTATISGLFTNTSGGKVTVLNANATFGSKVFNNGGWISDPSTITYLGDLTVGNNGSLSMAAGDVYSFKSNFFNQSTQSNSYNTIAGKFLFSGTSQTQSFAVAGIDLFAPAVTATSVVGMGMSPPAVPDPTAIPAFSNNFALGTLEIAASSTVRVDDAFINDGQMAALYLSNLVLNANSVLLISTNVEVYFLYSNDWASVGASAQLLNNPTFNDLISGLHQMVVPEPSLLLLCCGGAATIAWCRRRRTRK